MGRMPTIYRLFSGAPLRWQDDATGELPAAIKAFFGSAQSRATMSQAQIELVRDYCEYYVLAPCWSTQGMEAQFVDLRGRVRELKTALELRGWLYDALHVGVDPF